MTGKLLPAILFAAALSTTCALADGTYYSYYDGKQYEFKITAERQARCPKWDAEKDANPPLPAAKALSKAKEFIATIPTKDGLSWEFEELSLVNVDGWVWRARYRLTNHGLRTGVWPWMDCWILMDGSVIQPKVTKDKK